MNNRFYCTIIKINILLIAIILIIPLSFTAIAIEDVPEDKFHILIINSYSSENAWEQLVLNGFKEKLAPYSQVDVSVEYLDSKGNSDETYTQSFLNLLSIKYRNTEIDAVLTVDDEAFKAIRPNVTLNPQRFMYHIPTIFIGANENISLTEEESKYITGVIEIEDNLKFLNMLLDIHPNLKKINVLLDNSTFSNTVKNNIAYVKQFTKRFVDIEFIQGTYIEDIIDKISTISGSNQVFLLVGDYKSSSTRSNILTKDTINILKSATTNPIYTKIEPYLSAGAIGGIVDIGMHHGMYAGEILIRLLNGESIDNIKPIYNTLDITLFNYDTLQEYNINPMLLPEDAVYINKGPLDFLLPRWAKFVIISAIITGITIIIYFIFKYYKNKQKAILNEILLNQAIENEKLKTDFITTVSHELRTPLNIILNTSKLLQLKLEDNIIDTGYICNKLLYINQSSVRLLRLINNIIDISKLESGFIEPNFENMNIVEVIEETVLSAVDFAKSSNIELIFDTEDEEIITAIDKTKIERAVLNILSNAIKFTPSNGKITVNMKKQDNTVIFEIKDTGIGIPENQLKSIFDRFHQVDSSLTRANEGSGLGLYIVKGLIDIHNGKIEVESTENVGTTFTISLPIKLIANDGTNHNLGDDLEQLVKVEMSDLKDKN